MAPNKNPAPASATNGSNTVTFVQITIAAAPTRETDPSASAGGVPPSFFENIRTTIVGMVQAAMAEAVQQRPTQVAAESARTERRNRDFRTLQDNASAVHWEILTVSWQTLV